MTISSCGYFVSDFMTTPCHSYETEIETFCFKGRFNLSDKIPGEKNKAGTENLSS